MSKRGRNIVRVPGSSPSIPHYTWRKEELGKLLRIPTDEFLEKYSERVQVVESLHKLYEFFAELLFREIENNNRNDKATKAILPVGPTEQYPLLLEKVIENSLNLKNCHFFFMDEYCHEDGRPLGPKHPLGMRSTVERLLFGPLEEQAPELSIPREQIYFPDPTRPWEIQEMIDAVGGVDTCYGGIGVHGHVAFNEPEEGVEDSDTRVLRPNLITKTINLIRSDHGGFFFGFPDLAVTMGMRQILGCPRIVLFPRNRVFNQDGTPFQYINTAVRVAVAGGIDATPAGDYPVSFCGATKPGNPRRILKLYTTRDALESPNAEILSIGECEDAAQNGADLHGG